MRPVNIQKVDGTTLHDGMMRPFELGALFDGKVRERILKIRSENVFKKYENVFQKYERILKIRERILERILTRIRERILKIRERIFIYFRERILKIRERILRIRAFLCLPLKTGGSL